MNSIKQNALALALITTLSLGFSGAALAKAGSAQDATQEQSITTPAPQKAAPHNTQKRHQVTAGKQATPSESGKAVSGKKHAQQPAE